jgi:hypothetical protein
MSLARGVGLLLPFLLVTACAASRTSRAHPFHADAARPAFAAVDEERERRIDAFLAPGRGEIAAQGTLPPGLDQPLPKETAALLAKCDAGLAKAEARAKAAKDPTKAMKEMTRWLASRDRGCVWAEVTRTSRESYITADARAQILIGALADAVARSPATCLTGERNPAPVKNIVCMHEATMIWDRAGWSCVAPRLTDDVRAKFDDRDGYVYSFSIDRDLGTYEVIAEGCYSAGGESSASRTELVIRGRLGEPPKATQFFRREAVTD